jgi:fatty acid desaturase
MWLIPFALFLPWIRMNAEADEHDYGAGCEVEGTFTNKGGWNWLYHPDGDEYHMAHHCFPAVPIQRLARLDREARRVSPLYAETIVRPHR